VTASHRRMPTTPDRNDHRLRIASACSAVRVIGETPRCTGRQVRNKQPKSEVLVDVERPLARKGAPDAASDLNKYSGGAQLVDCTPPEQGKLLLKRSFAGAGHLFGGCGIPLERRSLEVAEQVFGEVVRGRSSLARGREVPGQREIDSSVGDRQQQGSHPLGVACRELPGALGISATESSPATSSRSWPDTFLSSG
jgi:hypothetical protein